MCGDMFCTCCIVNSAAFSKSSLIEYKLFVITTPDLREHTLSTIFKNWLHKVLEKCATQHWRTNQTLNEIRTQLKHNTARCELLCHMNQHAKTHLKIVYICGLICRTLSVPKDGLQRSKPNKGLCVVTIKLITLVKWLYIQPNTRHSQSPQGELGRLHIDHEIFNAGMTIHRSGHSS